MITGASSGIGKETARLLARRGDRLILLARRRPLLEALATELAQQHQAQVEILVADLALPGAAQKVVDILTARGEVVDVLVNNAGFGLLGQHAALPVQHQLEMVQVNVTALVELTRLLLPAMMQRRRGGVINVASTAAFQAGPGMAVYYATKAFVLSYTEALHEELKDTGLQVTCLCPGPTDTGFVEVAGMQGVKAFRFGADSPLAVAVAGLDGLDANRAIAIAGLRNRLLVWAGKFAPRWLTRKVVGLLNRK